MADFEELRNMVSSFRVSELQVLLGFAGRNKSGRKHDLLMRALHLLKSGCSPAVQIKIRELYRRRYPRTIEGLSDLPAIKPTVFNLDSSSSPVEPDLAVAGIHPLPSTSVTPQSPSSPVSSVLLQDTKPHFEMQQPSPPIPPVHPDVQLKSLPFYDVLDVLIKPTSLVQSSIQRFQEKFFIFALTPQQVREICISRDFLPGGRRDYTVQVQLRLCLAETSCPQEDNYPNSLCIKVNGKLFPLPGYAPPPKNGIEQKRPGRPLNITSLVRLSSAVPNQISISWASEIGKNYSMSVYLVRQLTSAMLLQRLKMKGIRNPDHSRALIKEKLTADPDSEIATTSLRVSLMCPLGKMRLTIPCRAVTCTHLQCFDAALYLQMNEKKPTWICPVCDKKAAYESLILDGLFMEILNECSDVDEIKFQEDGSWCPMRPKKEAVKVSSPQCTKIESSSVVSKQCSVTVANEVNKKKVDVIDLTIESSSDEEEDPPAKRKCIFMSETQGSPTKGFVNFKGSHVSAIYCQSAQCDNGRCCCYSSFINGLPGTVPSSTDIQYFIGLARHKTGMILEMFPYWLPMGGGRDLLLVFGLVHVVTLLHSSIFYVMTFFMSQFGRVRSGFSFTNPS
ncbi:E3 SUMO-protein ligase PIAS2 isoform X3 [Falco rusticolus]|uniref:E3 SUMO-protein ligase PIAS2 isoform X3 n=1 Tax=Falco rusticolus TaxID=120794 RepID=UPI0018869952|nr:E3 SUMO-protein ligase PIAS2 isoform X3 [Falco rusticolus]XP_037230490.1 E3 SUMO-protein ligase PIAS2 isoform X3 [Falco rusticolus]XP_037230492.1 E3 SUMO-protein ligase PIAS2 isoform X3 [Falco rusticolus]XP_055554708.1 E3 SUMO-protein ligase PIAS2 isoform X4 [Falco cherrug]XP_055554710.1 E3 SUMO-protein ligase PIAS2 isoform X4 [Falco cherrug]XP_055554714.1 E3 SUMO-protein ligase PIAS2 isoform X4 [Falco cherrug]XP_055554715.1 E3 SUMO-protein ligase PIAS2 isoform X4 [Falco cherrug]